MYVVLVSIFLRNRVFVRGQKYPLANFRVELFSCRSILLFQGSRHGHFLHIAFARDVTETVGRWLIVNQKHDDYASTALTFVNVTNTTKL